MQKKNWNICIPWTGRSAAPGAAHAAGRTAGDGIREMCGADTRRG